MNYSDWNERRKEEERVKLEAKEITMTHGMTATTKRLHRDEIAELMHKLDQISLKNNGNTPRLGLYGDMSWDLVNMENDEWIMGGKDIYEDFDKITRQYQKISDLERSIKDMEMSKAEYLTEMQGILTNGN